MKIQTAIGAILILSAPASLFGDAVTVLGTAEITFIDTFPPRSDYNTMRVWADGYPEGGRLIYGGIYKLEKGASTGAGDLLIERADGFIYSFCIDLPQSTPDPSTWYDVLWPKDAPQPEKTQYGTPMGPKKQELLRELWGERYDSIFDGSLPKQKENAEAFSAAVWEIVYTDIDSFTLDVTVDDDTSEKGFRAEGLNTTLANLWLSTLDDGKGTKANLRAVSHGTKQDYLCEVVPEPAAVVRLVALGASLFCVACVCGIRRRWLVGWLAKMHRGLPE